jgi:hypothetical protein
MQLQKLSEIHRLYYLVSLNSVRGRLKVGCAVSQTYWRLYLRISRHQARAGQIRTKNCGP